MKERQEKRVEQNQKTTDAKAASSEQKAQNWELVALGMVMVMAIAIVMDGVEKVFYWMKEEEEEVEELNLASIEWEEKRLMGLKDKAEEGFS